MKKFLSLFITILFLSCQSEKTSEIDILKSAFGILVKDNLKETEIKNHYEFPFYNDKNIHYKTSDFLTWQKNVLDNAKKGIKIEDIEIINEYTNENYNSDLFRDNKGHKKLERVLNLVKGKSKVFEIIFNRELYLKNDSSVFVIYNTENQKIIGFIE